MGKQGRTSKKPPPLQADPDPYFQETPWDIVRDDKGRVVGEIFMLPARMTSRGRKDGKGKAKLTDRQAQALEIIKEFQVLNGYAPSNRELCKAMGIHSSSTAHGIIERLHKKGYITKEINAPRAMRITDFEQEDEITGLRRKVAELEEKLRQQRPDLMTMHKHDALIGAVLSELKVVGD